MLCQLGQVAVTRTAQQPTLLISTKREINACHAYLHVYGKCVNLGMLEVTFLIVYFGIIFSLIILLLFLIIIFFFILRQFSRPGVVGAVL